MKGDTPLLASRIPLRSGLLAIQVGISVLLVTDASLITRALGRVTVQDPGFDAHDVAVVTFELPGSYDTPRRRAFSQQLLQRGELAVAPRPAAVTDTAPFARGVDGPSPTAGAAKPDSTRKCSLRGNVAGILRRDPAFRSSKDEP